MTRRINITFPDALYDRLEAWAESEDRKVAALAQYLVLKALDEAEAQGKIPKPKPKEIDRNG